MFEFNFFGEGSRFNHAGMVVKSIAAVFPDQESITDPVQKVKILFIVLNGLRIELLEPLGKDSPVAMALKSGIKLVHLCYDVPDISHALNECRAKGFHLVAKPVSAKAFDMRKIAWVFHKHFGLFELLEREA